MESISGELQRVVGVDSSTTRELKLEDVATEALNARQE